MSGQKILSYMTSKALKLSEVNVPILKHAYLTLISSGMATFAPAAANQKRPGVKKTELVMTV